MVKLIFLLSLSVLSSISHSDAEWFYHDKKNNTYSINGVDVRPSSLFRSLSLHSGLEIKYDSELKEGLSLQFKEARLKNVIRYIDSEFSTFKQFSTDQFGREILISISVLPKGKLSSSNMIIAVDPIYEATVHEKGSVSGDAANVYVTRMEKLETKVRQQLEKLAQKNIDREEKQELKKLVRIKNRDKDKKEAVAELKELKSIDQDAYAIRLKTLSWKYPDIEKSLAEN